MKKPLEEATVVVLASALRQLERDAVLLKAVKDAGYLDGATGEAIMKIANLEYKYHLM